MGNEVMLAQHGDEVEVEEDWRTQRRPNRETSAGQPEGGVIPSFLCQLSAEKKGTGPQGGLGRGRGLRYGCRRGGYLCLKESSFVDGGGDTRFVCYRESFDGRVLAVPAFDKIFGVLVDRRRY
eukprot:scaffold1327_cov217-Alexandrium_tamarense.AAC.5